MGTIAEKPLTRRARNSWLARAMRNYIVAAICAIYGGLQRSDMNDKASI